MSAVHEARESAAPAWQPPWRAAYDARVARLRAQLEAMPPEAPIRLAKQTSNLFRQRTVTSSPGLDVLDFDGVLEVDPIARTAEVQGMTTYEHLVDATLAYGLMPLCVPQLKTITLGGAVTGLGIESSSFRWGLPHESVLEMDVLTGDGRVLTISGRVDDPHRDLYYGFPNSYGTLGYALRLKISLEPVLPYVRLRHVRFPTADAMAQAIAEITVKQEWDGEPVHFLDGTVFSAGEQYLSLGEMVPDRGSMTPSDYTGMGIYYRSIPAKREDLLTIHDYIWRWDTDWFWCSRAFGTQKTPIRRLWPKDKLRSDVYWRIIAWDRRTRFSSRMARLRRHPAREEVVQDIEVPVHRLADFLDFFHREVGIEPVWVCPLRQRDPSQSWPLYEFDPEETYVNVGFWSTVPLPGGVDPAEGRINRRIEEKVAELDGRKSLYSSAYYGPEEFWSIYGGEEYRRLKGLYDPDSRLLDLYDKVVRRR